MRVQVIGGCGAWPADGQACSGYLIEHDGFRILLDPGYGVATAMSGHLEPGDLDAVFVSHGHPDHCADLHPLLRGRVLGGSSSLPIYAIAGAIDGVVSWDGLGELDGAYNPIEIADGDDFVIGPFRATTMHLPHFVPNCGIRLAVDSRVAVYTGDAGPSTDLLDLAEGADLLIAEATFPREVPETLAGNLSTAVDVAMAAAKTDVGRLVLTHLWPGTDRDSSEDAARQHYDGEVDVAVSGLTVDFD